MRPLGASEWTFEQQQVVWRSGRPDASKSDFDARDASRTAQFEEPSSQRKGSPMISDDFLERLRYKGEGPDLDFKQAQYRFIGASEFEKCELLKDVLAVANAYRLGSGYILIGFKDQTPHPAEVVGIAPSDHID